MGREELLRELQLLRTTNGTLDDVRARFALVHTALEDIRRKRSRFVEDALAALLRVTDGMRRAATGGQESDSEGDDDDSRHSADALRLARQHIELGLEFVEPLVSALAVTKSSSDNGEDLARERAVVVAFLLHLMGSAAVTALITDDTSMTLCKRIAQLIVGCGVALDAILSTARFREELEACSQMLLPPSMNESDSDEEQEGDDDSDDSEWGDEADSRVLFQTAAAPWNLREYEYFVKPAGQEYGFASWSTDGIRNFAFVLLVEAEDSKLLTTATSPGAWLFVLAPSIQSLLQSEGNTQLVPDAELPFSPVDAEAGGSFPSFKDKRAAFAKRDWLTPLIQLLTNVMVSSPDPKERSFSLATLRSLVSKVLVGDRFRLLQGLVLKCPYANVSAVFVDEVRSNAVQLCSTSSAGGHAHYHATDEFNRLLILEAVLESTLAGFS
ncbi:hypothetical protein PybrP1_006564 [[Pythium] brassicae (nom. inval.)]|nr:hypothetical protein PybrP1_006564 [[Pythium] brassicae (nom. inval.)]